MSTPAPKPTTPRLGLSIEEASQSIGCSWDFWQEHIAPSMPIVRAGRRQIVPVRAIESWLADHAESVR